MNINSNFLASSVAYPLSKCLQELVQIRPRDPIDWIAQWLYKFKDSDNYLREKKRFIKKMRHEKKVLDRDQQAHMLRKICLKDKIRGLRRSLRRHEEGTDASIFSFSTSQLSTEFDSMDFERMAMQMGKLAGVPLKTLKEEQAMRHSLRMSSMQHDTLIHIQTPPSSSSMTGDSSPRPFRASQYSHLSQYMQDELSHYSRKSSKTRTRVSTDNAPSPKGSDEFLTLRRIRKKTGTGGSCSSSESFSSYSSEYSGDEDDRRRRKTASLKPQLVGWSLSCQWGLICRHPVLGDLEPRPPLIYPETPDWWYRRGYIQQSLYDHEVYARDNTDDYPGWDDMEHMTYRDFVHTGPWLSEGMLMNMQPSLADMYSKTSRRFKKGKAGGHRKASEKEDGSDERRESKGGSKSS